MHILLIEDEPHVAAFIKKGLSGQGYGITLAGDGVSGAEIAVKDDFALVILDVMLPKLNGIEVCKIIRGAKKDVPIIMLTALGTVQNKVEGLESGADDYLTKPFHFEELLARIKALERRQKVIKEARTYRVADLEMDSLKRTVFRGGKEVFLSAKEFTLLEFLMSNVGLILSRAQIAEAVWGINFDRGTNLIDVYINYLRAKIDKDFKVKLIHTMIGKG
ncbi:MAG: response regulator, partial [Bacteroidia bacterium]|nr:response regulator [Bacteroidia bacterium]